MEMDVFDKLSNYIEELEQGGKQARTRVVELVDEVNKLEEENKKLKDNVEFLHSCLDDRDKSIAIMQEENKKLKKERDLYKARNEELNENCYSLAKENDELKKELDKLKSTYVYDAKQVRDIC